MTNSSVALGAALRHKIKRLIIVHGHQEQISYTLQTAHHHRCAVDATTKQGQGIPVGNVSTAAILRACVLQAKLMHFTGGGRNNNRCSSPSHNIYNNTSNQHRSAEKIYSSPLPPHPSKNIKTIQEILLLQQPTKYM